jgi:hypothetical protein
MKLLTEQPWKAITRAVKREPGKCHVAVAYFGQGAAQMLPLREGSLLVLDFSEASVRAGRSCPAEVLKLLKQGVEIRSVRNLHAKVFVVGSMAFIGSTNVSKASANTLVEAVAVISDPHLIRQSRRFVIDLVGESVSEEFARQMAAIYRPPIFPKAPRKARKTQPVVSEYSPTWVVQLTPCEWDDADHAADEVGRPVAQQRLEDSGRFEIDEFCWSKADFARRVKPGEMVVQVLAQSPHRPMVSAPARVLFIQNYLSAKGRENSIVFVERLKGSRPRSLQQLRKSLGSAASKLRPKSHLTRLRDSQMIHLLHRQFRTRS